jgi:hypothetical protein
MMSCSATMHSWTWQGGNVFRVIPHCEAEPQPHWTGPAKLAFASDDAWQVTLIAKQTGHSLKRLPGFLHWHNKVGIQVAVGAQISDGVRANHPKFASLRSR